MTESVRFWRQLCSAVIIACLGANTFAAQESVCARVVIQIEQELTLEREGFEARLGVTNGLPTALENLRVTLNFADADGNAVGAATDALPNPDGRFYYRVQTGYSGVTSVAASATAKIAYLIVPSPGAAGDSATGKLYYVGATVKYTSAGVEETVLIAPDFIYVRPMPLLQLQYFIPGDVYGDDPYTAGVQESPVPFPLGVRIINHSLFATANAVRIQSSQPEIIDNEQGLLIAFELVASRVNDKAVTPSLDANFGDIAPQRSSVASWDMMTSLSGRFVRFTAEVSHSEEFGGALTSLIPHDAISTHRLLGQVVVDFDGRDGVPDFLAVDAMVGDITAPKLFESDTAETSHLIDYFPPGSSSVLLVGAGATITLEVDTVSTVFYARTTSPVAADKLVRAVRSDGKVLPATNAWISKSQNPAGDWFYTLNLFDTNKAAGHNYALTFIDRATANRPPMLTIQGGNEFTVGAGRLFKLGMTAVDPDGTLPILSSSTLPFGATFVTEPGGVGFFNWIPTINQTGSFTLQFKASDGMATTTVNVFVHVVASALPGLSTWQRDHWPFTDDILVVGPNANPDGDQLNNLLEYALNSNPTQPDDSVLPEVSIVTSGAVRYLALTYRRRTNDPALHYEVIASDDLLAPVMDWAIQTQTEPASQTDLPADMERVTVRDSVPIASGPPSRYLKLRITQKEIE
jgi:hypothetical protein